MASLKNKIELVSSCFDNLKDIENYLFNLNCKNESELKIKILGKGLLIHKQKLNDFFDYCTKQISSLDSEFKINISNKFYVYSGSEEYDPFHEISWFSINKDFNINFFDKIIDFKMGVNKGAILGGHFSSYVSPKEKMLRNKGILLYNYILAGDPKVHSNFDFIKGKSETEQDLKGNLKKLIYSLK